MASYTFQLTTTNVSGGVVTLPVQAVALKRVIQEIVGFHTTSQEAPVTYTVVSTTPTTTSQVQLTATNKMTFNSSTSLNTTYGVVTMDYVPVGAAPIAAP